MTSTVDQPNWIVAAVQSALAEQVQKVVNEEADAAAKRVRERVAAMAGAIATTLVKRVSSEYPLDGTLDIIVRLRTK